MTPDPEAARLLGGRQLAYARRVRRWAANGRDPAELDRLVTQSRRLDAQFAAIYGLDRQPFAALGDELLAAALEYATRGWALVPVVGKAPVLGRAWQRQATVDADKIRGWVEDIRPTGLGVYLPTSGLVCVDVDDPERCTVAERLGVRFDAGLVIRGGRGVAVLYERPESMAARNRRVGGFEVRGNGQQVLPPSAHPSGTIYRWAHYGGDALELPARLARATVAAVRPATPAMIGERLTVSGYYRLAGLIRTVERATVGNRSNALNWAAYQAGRMRASEAVVRPALLRAAEENGLVAEHGIDAAERTITSGLRAGWSA